MMPNSIRLRLVKASRWRRNSGGLSWIFPKSIHEDSKLLYIQKNNFLLYYNDPTPSIVKQKHIIFIVFISIIKLRKLSSCIYSTSTMHYKFKKKERYTPMGTFFIICHPTLHIPHSENRQHFFLLSRQQKRILRFVI